MTMKWLLLAALLPCKISAFVSPGLAWSSTKCPRELKSVKVFEPILLYSSRPMTSCRSTPDENAEKEGKKAGAPEITDAELEVLLQGMIVAPTQEDPSKKRRSDLDEMKLVLALRRQLGEEDFYTIFDPRNPRIGDL